MVTIVNKEPDKSVVKEKVCYHCGVTLSYVPIDVKNGYTSDYIGDKDFYKYIVCPNCNKQVRI